MPQAIVYCDRCANMIPPGELKLGRAIIAEGAAICPECAASLSPEQRQALEKRIGGAAAAQAEAPHARASTRRTTRVTSQRRPTTPRPGAELARRAAAAGRKEPSDPPRGSITTSRLAARAGEAGAAPSAEASRRRTIAIVGIAAGVLVGAAIAALLASGTGRRKTTRPRDDDTTADVDPRPPTDEAPLPPVDEAPPRPTDEGPIRPVEPPPAPGGASARQRLAAIRKMEDPFLRRYPEMKKALQGFPEEHPDAAREIAEAKSYLDEISARFDWSARLEFGRAAQPVKKLVAEWEYDEAAKALERYRARYGESEWFASEGKVGFETELKNLEGAALARAEEAVERARGARARGDLDGALKALAEHAKFPDPARARAHDLHRKVAAELDEKRRRRAVLTDFLVGFHEAGGEGLPRVEALLKAERAKLRGAGLGDRLTSFEGRHRRARAVEASAGLAFGTRGRTFQLEWKGKAVAGSSRGVIRGVLKLRTLERRTLEIPIGELGPAEVLKAAGGGVTALDAANYRFVRGDLDGARKRAAKLTGRNAAALLDDIDAVDLALAWRGAASALSEGLVLWLRFDEREGTRAADSSGKGRHGALREMAGTKWTEGRVGGALSFDGEDDYVEVGAVGISGSAPRTIAGWVRASPRDRRGWAGVFGFSAQGAQNDQFFDVEVDGTTYKLHVRGAQYNLCAMDTEWHHVAGTYEGTTIVGYVDGARVVAQRRLLATLDTVVVGRRSLHEGCFKGLIDDVRVYDRALSGAEMRLLFAGGRLVQVSTEDLVAWLRFDESEGTKARDASGNGNVGTLTNMDGTEWVEGRLGGALRFDGEDDWVSVANEASFDIERDITVAAWIKVASFTKDWQSVVTKGDGSWRLHRKGNSNALAFHCNGAGNADGKADGPIRVDDGEWHHAAGVYDGMKARLYVDGGLDASVDASKDMNVNDHEVRVGGNAQMDRRQFRGLIDDVRIYKRALSADEIVSLVVGAGLVPRAPPGPTRGLRGEYFEGRDLDPARLKAVRIDPRIQFHWGRQEPLPGVNADDFSVRWTGELEVPGDGEYEFRLDRDDGARLWVSGRLVVDAWTDARGIDRGKATLEAGWVPIKVEFKEHGGDAHVKLSWRGPGVAEGVIAGERFRPPPGEAPRVGEARVEPSPVAPAPPETD